MTIKHTMWPFGEVPPEFKRPELDQLWKFGYTWKDPFDIVEQFESKVAKFANAKYATAVDCCSHGLFLALKYQQASGTVTIPKRTYLSVPMQIIHAGCKVELEDLEWSGHYQLKPYPIWDAAGEWQENMYTGGMFVVSFQHKKRIPIGRGGMILTDDAEADRWFKRARYDGRDLSKTHFDDECESIGWHFYMTPEDAARGIILMDHIGGTENRFSSNSYSDLTTKKFLS